MSGQTPLPPASWPTSQDLSDLQGDVVLGIPKRTEDFVFFTISDAASFKHNLKQLLPAITTTADVQKLRKQIGDHKSKNQGGLIKVVGINLAFSATGLAKLGITEKPNDPNFDAGMLARAQALGDPGTTDSSGNFVPKWAPEFKSQIDGIVLVAGDCRASVEEGTHKVEQTLGKSIKEVLKVVGNVRPGKEKGHEHFGFMDGISSPSIKALTGQLPGQIDVQPGVLVCNQLGDGVTRPDWTKNGSFLVYRQLDQLVPEFSKFLDDNPLNFPEIPKDQGSALLGARLVGRWKSGAPVDLSPLHDDPALAADPQRNNNFDFSAPPGLNDQTRCPFAAHVRKTNPRKDLANGPSPHVIVRQGIPFGDEVTPPEAQSHQTKKERGLAFVCYQSNLANGFEFLQEAWANNTGFIFGKTFNGQPVNPGFDPIIGQNHGGSRSMVGSNSSDPTKSLVMPNDFVVSKGGQYFFSPSISALKAKFTA